MAIVPLQLEHEAALGDFLDDFAQAGETDIPAYFAKPDWSHAETVRTFAAWSRGEETGGWVPTTTSFLVQDGRLLGVSNFRHELTEELMRHGGNVGYSVRPSDRGQGHGTTLLREAMDFGRSLGLARILVTCEPSNIGSVRVVEKNGGVLEDEIYHEQEGCRVRLYWITL